MAFLTPHGMACATQGMPMRALQVRVPCRTEAPRQPHPSPHNRQRPENSPVHSAHRCARRSPGPASHRAGCG